MLSGSISQGLIKNDTDDQLMQLPTSIKAIQRNDTFERVKNIREIDEIDDEREFFTKAETISSQQKAETFTAAVSVFDHPTLTQKTDPEKFLKNTNIGTLEAVYKRPIM